MPRLSAALFVGLALAAVARAESPGDSDSIGAIDRLVEAGWQARGVTPAMACDDRTFVRRVYLDLVGQIPTPAEAQAFLGDPAEDRRTKLVDALLAEPRHARHMAEVFDVVLMGRGEERAYRRRREAGWFRYLETAFRDNRPWDQVAREIVLGRPTADGDPAAVWFLYARKDKHQEIAEAVAPAFFGVRVECAQCHDHPVVPEIEQGHYWGLVAFFSRSKNVDTPRGPRVAESAVGGFAQYKNLAGEASDNLLRFLDVATVEEARPTGEQKDADDLYHPGAAPDAPKVPNFSRREKFADAVLARHPRLARAFVNRAWALLMGRGIVHPVDEMDSVHPPSHPELLDRLAADFEASGYDIRRLLRSIALSRPYQLAGKPTAPDVHPDSFAYAIEKPLTAESYARSLAVAAGGVSDDDADKLAAELRPVFPDVFPRDNVATLSQALLVSNRPAFQSLAAVRPGSTAERMVAADSDDGRVEIAFDAALCRAPDERERAQAVAFLKTRSDRPADASSELLWALLASAEFRFNH
jgi:hypothetical protein